MNIFIAKQAAGHEHSPCRDTVYRPQIKFSPTSLLHISRVFSLISKKGYLHQYFDAAVMRLMRGILKLHKHIENMRKQGTHFKTV